MPRLLTACAVAGLVLLLGASRISADGNAIDRVVVDKSERRMLLLSGSHVVASYRIALGANPVGHKRREGDERTPEGGYRLDWRNIRSGYFKSIHVSYPDQADKADAESRKEDPGGLIMIHGQPNYFGWLAPLLQHFDWTDGCIAVTNVEMQEIWNIVPDNTSIDIRS
jgi:murein L,D-transpeptidase YafK